MIAKWRLPKRRLQSRPTATTTNSFGIKTSSGGTWGSAFGEMKFHNVSIGNAVLSNTTNNKGVFIQSTEANIDFTDTNIENFNVGFVIQGASGTPLLSYTGGHFERDIVAFIIQQAQLHLTGVNMGSGDICPDSSTWGSDINIGASFPGYPSAIIDNGAGNQIHVTTSSGAAQNALNFDGSEQCKTPTLTAESLGRIEPPRAYWRWPWKAWRACEGGFAEPFEMEELWQKEEEDAGPGRGSGSCAWMKWTGRNWSSLEGFWMSGPQACGDGRWRWGWPRSCCW